MKVTDGFVHLHVHSTYSFQDGYGLPEQLCARAAELEMPALALTDHGGASGHRAFAKSAKRYGVKPIFGIEFYIVEDVGAAREAKDRRKCHLTVLARDEEGYRNLLSLHDESWRRKYYKPNVDWSMFEGRSRGLVVLSGCYFSILGRAFSGEECDMAEMEGELLRQKALVCDAEYYAEVQFLPGADLVRYNRRVVEAARAAGVPLVATNDVHYPLEGQHDMGVILGAIRRNKKTRDMPPTEGQKNLWLKSGEEMRGAMDDLGFDCAEALDETYNIADGCEAYGLPRASSKGLLFEKAGDADARLRELAEAGLKARGLAGRPEYDERLSHELSVIAGKGFSEYFLVVEEFISWAKSRGIAVGPGRGSAAGSLACYALRITESIDPVEHGLLFERFLAPHRGDPPDIDVDMSDVDRGRVVAHLSEVYGEDRVAAIGAFTEFSAKNTADDLGRVAGVPFEAIGALKAVADEEGLSYAKAVAHPKAAWVLQKHGVMRYGERLEGQVRHMTKHAAGMVVAARPLEGVVPVCVVKGERVIGLDMEEVGEAGLLKIDFLGRRTLGLMQAAARAAE